MKATSAIQRHVEKLPCEVQQDLVAWANEPELGKLVSRLVKSSDEQFLDTYAEVIVARHLLLEDCLLRVEVPNPNGKFADFEVRRNGLKFFVHVKRLTIDGSTKKHLRISKRVGSIEKINRPFNVSLSFRQLLSDEDMRLFVKGVSKFLYRGNVGEREVIMKTDGTELGNCTIDREHPIEHVEVKIISHPFTNLDVSNRVYKCLSDAYKQFMPDAVNVILVNQGWSDDLESFDNALLGTERVTVSPGGSETNLERMTDGFWSAKEHPESQVTGWFDLLPNLHGFRLKVW